MRPVATTPAVVIISIAIAMCPAPVLGAEAVATKTAILDEVAETYQPQRYANHVWTMVAAALVLAMQAGFLMLEAGLSRTASAINVAMKNLIDFIVAACFFYVLGFGLMFGASAGGWIGTTEFMPNAGADPWRHTFFVFQMVFAGTAATIVSGAVAERTRIYAYVIMTLVCVSLYTIGGHWAWGNLLDSTNGAWLADLGFVDFAGSTVVHATGGWLALAAAMVVGARRWRFGENARTFQPNNAAWATLGTLLLWIGWIGFNGGSTTAATPEFAHIVANTMVAGAFGGLTYILVGFVEDRGLLRPERPIVGVLAGLVAVTAGCQVLDQRGALVVGIGGALVAWLGVHLLEKLKIDDVVAAVPVHAFAGAFGTMALAVLAPPEALPAGGRWAQVQVQALGVAVFFAWAFGVGLTVLWCADAIWRAVERHNGHDPRGFRVDPDTEERGLNAEHGVTLGTAVVQDALRGMVEQGELRREISVDPGDENAEIAALVNRMRRSMLAVIDGIASNADALATAAERVVDVAGQVGAEAGKTRSGAETAETATARTAVAVEDVHASVRNVESDLAAVSDRASDIAGRVARASEATARIRDVAEQAGTRADETRTEAARASATTTTTAAHIDELQTLANRIGETAGSISDVAERTRIVALNASIEAKQAGEAGKGFGVVAQEVKKLSDKVDRAAGDIGDLARRISGGTGEAARTTRELSAVVERVEAAVRDTVEVARECSGLARDVEGTLSETDGAARAVAESVQSIHGHAEAAGGHADTAAGQAGSVRDEMDGLRRTAGRNDELARDLNAAAEDIRARIADLRRVTDQAGGGDGRRLVAAGEG